MDVSDHRLARKSVVGLFSISRPALLAAVLERGAYEHAARASESAPMKIHSLARRACITQAPIID